MPFCLYINVLKVNKQNIFHVFLYETFYYMIFNNYYDTYIKLNENFKYVFGNYFGPKITIHQM